MNISHLCKSFALAGTGMSRTAGVFMLFLLVLAFAPAAAFAQEPTATWRVQVWEQDDGGPYDQFAPFCEAGSPCAAVVGVEVCVGANCQTTSGSPSTAVFTGLSFGPQTACLTDPNWLVVSGSAGGPLDGPNCVTRDFTGDEEGPDQSTAMYVEQNVFEVTVTKAYTVAHPVADPEVELTLICDAGTVSTEDPNAVMEEVPLGDDEPKPVGSSATTTTEEGSASFWVIGTANCYVTEVVPPGYVQSDSDCGDEANPGIVLPDEEPIGCTITNRPTEATLTVDKNFSDYNPVLQAAVTPLCTDAGGGPGITYSPANGNALHGTNFVTTVRYFAGATNCTASEVDLVGYTQDLAQSTCDEGAAITDETNGSCVIFNDQDPIEIEASKIYSNGGGASVDFAVECTNLASGGSVTPPTAAAAPGSPAVFTVNDVKWDGSTLCSVSEPVPPGGYYESANTCTTDNLDMTPNSDDPRTCEITNTPTRATFKVTKIFADGNNVDEIEVSIDCNTGLILDQDKDLEDGEWVEFVVTSFTEGNLECTITEDGQAGYAGEYDNVSLGNVINDESCHYPAETIEGDSAHECVITNTPLPVRVNIYKDWVFEGTTEPDIDTYLEIWMWCTSEIVGGECGIAGPASDVPPDADSPAGDYYDWYGVCYANGGLNDLYVEFDVIPEFPTTSCSIYEYVYDGAIEQNNGCGEFTLSVGQGYDCTITNTVFYEGIPTLSQYGMALMALLMLGVGFVSFRRFS